MGTIDNSKIFLEGDFTDMDVTLAAGQKLQQGTVLGRNSDGKLVAFSTDNNVAATESKAAFTTEPIYILAQTIINPSSSAATEMDMVRVFDGGVVNKDKLVFVKSADKTNTAILDQLHKNGFVLETVQELSEKTCLAE